VARHHSIQSIAVRAAIALALIAATPVEHLVKPSVVDPRVQAFDMPNVAVIETGAASDAPLAVILPGTSGRPVKLRELIHVVAEQGYRVLGLMYDDEPAVVETCVSSSDRDCAAKFRQVRLDGSGPGILGVSNPVEESVENRLVATLRWLDHSFPDEGWGQYLEGDQPRWDRMVVSGLSQGAGMAAFIAKQHPVRRVVLFSSPWDFVGRSRRPSPWLSAPSATPSERWFAEYHRRENAAALIRSAYAALEVPRDHIYVFDLDLPTDRTHTSDNPYHAATAHDVRYAAQWRLMFGRADSPAS